MITELQNEKVARNIKPAPSLPELPVTMPISTIQFRIFTVLWAVASLFHMAHSSVFDAELNLALLTLAAFFAVFRPSLKSFLLLIGLQIFDAVFRMPFTTNHWIFTAFVNVTILHVILFLIVRKRGFTLREGEVFKTFAPLLRVEVIILYFFAVFHKLNSGFFAPATSCATDLLIAQNLQAIMPLTDQLFLYNAYFTLLVELSIPVLLCFRRTRNAGAMLGLIFHSVLSYSTYNAFYDFSSLMFAAYFVFLSPGYSLTVHGSFKKIRDSFGRFFQNYSFAKVIYTVLFVLFVLGSIYLLNKQLNSFKTVHLYFFWTLYSALFIGCLAIHMLRRRRPAAPLEPAFRVPHWSLLLIPLIVFLNGTLPYLGLKTENSYAMFSNLRTEGGTTNHFIVPATAQIFDYQKEVVEIVSSTDPLLQKLAEENKAMVLFEFRNYVHERKPARVEYLLNGERKVVTRGDNASLQVLGKNPYVLKKLMKFRPFAVSGPQPCAH